MIACCVGLSSVYGQAQTEDARIAARYFEAVPLEAGASFGSLMVRTGLFFLGTPYVAATLEINEAESLVINLRELDCTTFVESCLALSRVVALKTPNFEAYTSALQGIRYRDGQIDAYPSRLHYTSDWIYNNTQMGLVQDVTAAIGGRPRPLQLSFMSEHPSSYKQLKAHPEWIPQIRAIEQAVNARSYFYIPKAEITAKEAGIQDGDIICFVTSTEGLDISHVGLAYHTEGMLSFIHASSTAMKVIINPESIADYCKKIKSNAGIMVVRPQTPVLPLAQ